MYIWLSEYSDDLSQEDILFIKATAYEALFSRNRTIAKYDFIHSHIVGLCFLGAH